jgi:hypothetical protein
MATTSNPSLNCGDSVFVVILLDGEQPQTKGAVFFNAVVQEVTWQEQDNQYRYRAVGTDRNVWISEAHYNNAGVGKTITKNHNNARDCFRANIDLLFP